MKKEREFLQDLYRRRLFKVPFIELFQKNKDLRRELFQQYLKAKLVPEVSLYWDNFYNRKELDEMVSGKDSPLYALQSEFYELLGKNELPEKYYKHSLESTPILLELEEVSSHIEDFKRIVLKGKQYDPKEFAENIIKTIVRRRENISIPKVIYVILNDLLNEQENLHIEGQLIFDNEYQFQKRYGISFNEAKANYRELKRYADNCISEFLNSRPPAFPERVKVLFEFIVFLHSNIENFNQYNDLILDLEILNKERNKLSPKNNYTDKLQYDKVQVELESKFKRLQYSTANLIKAKAMELHFCNFDNEPIYNFNGIETDINNLKRNFREDDLPVIFRHKSLYLDYRTNTHKTFFSLQIFFEDLDEIAKSLFDYFKDTQRNEFEAFETTAIPVNSLKEAIEGFKKGNTKFTLPNNFLSNPVNVQQPTIEALPTHLTKKVTEKETGNDFILSTIEDWLFEFKEKMSEQDYNNLVSALKQYFDRKTFPVLEEKIKVARVNKKLFGWHLNRIFEALGKGVETELLIFAKDNISLFEDVKFDINNIQKSNLYKYFTTKTK